MKYVFTKAKHAYLLHLIGLQIEKCVPVPENCIREDKKKHKMFQFDQFFVSMAKLLLNLEISSMSSLNEFYKINYSMTLFTLAVLNTNLLILGFVPFLKI